LEDGSVQYIEGNSAFIFAFSYVDILASFFSNDLLIRHFWMSGAKQPMYLVTADDVETYLAIEVQPLDDRKRKVCPLDHKPSPAWEIRICKRTSFKGIFSIYFGKKNIECRNVNKFRNARTDRNLNINICMIEVL